MSLLAGWPTKLRLPKGSPDISLFCSFCLYQGRRQLHWLTLYLVFPFVTNVFGIDHPESPQK